MKQMYSNEAEVAILGSILLDEAIMYTCHEMDVTENTFFLPKNRRIFMAMEELSKIGRSIDHLTLTHKLKEMDKFEEIGGEDYLLKLVNDTPTSTNAVHYIKIAKDIERGWIAQNIARQMEDELHEGKKPRNVLANAMALTIAALTNESRQKSPDHHHQEHIRRRNLAKEKGVVGHELYLSESLGAIISSWVPPDNVIIGAKSSVGKTVLMLNELAHQAKKGTPVGIFSLDMTEFAIRQRIAARVASVNPFKFGKPYWTDLDAQRMDNAYKEIEKWPIYINDNSNATIDDISAWTMAMVAKHGIKFLAVDFIQQINRTEDEYKQDLRIVIGEWSKQLKSLGKRFNLVTMILSQFARYGEKASDKTPQMPTKEALKESGDIENNADIVILLCFQPGQPKELFTFKYPIWNVLANIDKQRDGPTGVVELCLRPSRSEFMSRAAGEDLRSQLEEKRRAEINSK